MARSIDPRYCLRLDDLPRVIQADDRVYPIWIQIRDAARLFSVTQEAIHRWIFEFGLPASKIGNRYYIETAALAEWVDEHSITKTDLRAEWAQWRREKAILRQQQAEAEAAAAQEDDDSTSTPS